MGKESVQILVRVMDSLIVEMYFQTTPSLDPMVMMLIFCQEPSGDGTIGASAHEMTTEASKLPSVSRIGPSGHEQS